MRRKRGVEVPPLSTKKIRAIAESVRGKLGLNNVEHVPVVELMEFVLPKFGIHYDIRPEGELGHDLARSFPDEGLIEIREDIYNKACIYDGFARFTISHEIGHIVCHAGVPLRRTDGPKEWPIYCDSEWQADTYASEFLMPVRFVQNRHSLDEMPIAFGVSRLAAEVRIEKLKKEGFL